MLVIRLFRTGKKNQPSFKVVVTDKKNPPKGGRFVEQIGFYNPKTKEKILNAERAKYWISKGAQPSATVHNMLVKEGVLEKAKMPKHGKSKKPAEAPKEEKKEAPAKETPKEAVPAEIKKEEPAPTEEKKEAAPAPAEEKKEEPKTEEKPAEAQEPKTEESQKEEAPQGEQK